VGQARRTVAQSAIWVVNQNTVIHVPLSYVSKVAKPKLPRGNKETGKTIQKSEKKEQNKKPQNAKWP